MKERCDDCFYLGISCKNTPNGRELTRYKGKEPIVFEFKSSIKECDIERVLTDERI